MDILSNPEVIRNVRSQLRWGRMISVAAICAVLSMVTGYSLAHSQKPTDPPGEWGMHLLQVALGAQALAIVLGGSIACLNAIHREKEMNTFDFQRVTRLTPWELALGKLFGAPAVVYFAALCLMPAALAGAIVGGARPTMVAAAYVILLLGSIALHAFALIISLLHQRGANTGAVLLLIFVLLSGISPSGQRQFFDLGPLSPFGALSIVEQKSWALAPASAGSDESDGNMADVFFGQRMHHLPVLLVLYASFAAWFLLAVTRNLKRDPSAYELYTPNQSLALLLYINLLMLGFFRWGKEPGGAFIAPLSPTDIQGLFLGSNLTMFLVLGLALVRNRDQVRRRLREMGDAASNWLAALWPAPYLLTGMLLAGVAAIGMIQWKHSPKLEWDAALAVFRLGIVALWVARDLLFLQWMNLTRARRPLVMGFVYLLVFYASASILFLTLSLFETARGKAITGFFYPGAALAVMAKDWQEAKGLWIAALLCQAAVAAVFVYLHRQKLRQLSPAHEAAPAAESPLPTTG